jgi:hypothetical protein
MKAFEQANQRGHGAPEDRCHGRAFQPRVAVSHYNATPTREVGLKGICRTVNDEYILQDRDGDYVENVESGTSETVKMHFTFTKDITKAKRFSYNDLWSPLATTSIGGEFTHGFGGGRAIKI